MSQTLLFKYLALVRCLLVPSGFLTGVLAVSLIFLAGALTMLIADLPQVGKVAYMMGVALFSFLLPVMYIQLAHMASRKTLTLCAPLANRLFGISLVVLTLWSLGVAPALQPPMEDFVAYLRIAGLIGTLASLGLIFVTQSRQGFFYFALLGFMLSSIDGLFDTLVQYARELPIGVYSLLTLFHLALWRYLHQSIARARLPDPAAQLRALNFNNDPNGNFNWFRSAITLPKTPSNPERILLLETVQPLIFYFILSISLTLILGLFILAYYEWILGTSVNLLAAAPLLVVLPGFMQIGNATFMGANLRRLWLTVSGGRARLFSVLERNLITLGITSCLPFFILALAVVVAAGEASWWILAWGAYLCLVTAMLSYWMLLTLAIGHYAMPAIRILLILAALTLSIVFWLWHDPGFSTAALSGTALATILFRSLAVKRWQTMDYAMIKREPTCA